MSALWSVRLWCKAVVAVCLVAAFAAGPQPAAAGGDPRRLPVVQAQAFPLETSTVAPLSPPDSDTIYDNETPNFFWVNGNVPTVLEDLTLSEIPGRIASIEFAFVVTATTDLLVEVRFWDGFDAGASPVNNGFLGGTAYSFGTLAPGSYATLDLPLSPRRRAHRLVPAVAAAGVAAGPGS